MLLLKLKKIVRMFFIEYFSIIQDIRQVTKKPLKTARRQWTEEEIEQLTKLYNEFKEAVEVERPLRKHTFLLSLI